MAGVTVAVVGIPQAIAYAELAGLPANRGLITAGVAAVLGALLGSSPSLQTGVTALASLLTFGVLAGRAPIGVERYIALASLLAIEAGLIRLVLRVRRLGRISYVLSQPVIVGLSTGAGVTIIASQVPAVLGVSGTSWDPIASVVSVLQRPAAIQWPAALSAATVLVLLVVLRRISRRIPAPLIALAIGSYIASRFDGVAAISLERPVLGVSWSTLVPDDVAVLFIPAVVMALIGFSEASAIARRYATQDRYRWDPDRELLGQGAASLGAGLVGGFPISGSFARTSLARLAGAKSRAAAVISGLVVLATVPFVPLLPPIPRPALAAVVMAAGFSLLDYEGMKRLLGIARLQFLVAAGTLIATLAFAPRVDLAVVAGVSLATAVHLFREEQLDVVTRRDGSVLRLEVQGVVFFASAPRLVEAITTNVAGGGVERVELDLSGVGRIDISGALAMADALQDLADSQIDAHVLHVPPHAERIVRGLLESRFEPRAEGASAAVL